MNKSEQSGIDPHRTGLFAGFFLAGASVLFGVVDRGIMLSGNDTFEVVGFGLGFENRYLRVLTMPFIAFFLGYVFAYTIRKGILHLYSLHDKER